MVKRGIFRHCSVCNNKFYVYPYRFKTQKTCSFKCAGISHRGLCLRKYPLSEEAKRNIGLKNHNNLLGRKPSYETKVKMGLSRCGSKNNFWSYGLRIRYNPRNKYFLSLRKEILMKQDNKCYVCGKIKKLQIHHVLPYKYCHEHNPTLMIALCRSCHSATEHITQKLFKEVFKFVNITSS
jgi:hypothetical protein